MRKKLNAWLAKHGINEGDVALLICTISLITMLLSN